MFSNFLPKTIAAMCLTLPLSSLSVSSEAKQIVQVRVTITNIAPKNGVAITPPWIGLHSGSFDSYNGGLRSLRPLERVAEDGNNRRLSVRFNDFNPYRGGYTFIDNSGPYPASRLVRTGDLSDRYRVDATVGSAPLLPGQSVSHVFNARDDGSNDFLSYVSMVLPSNDYFLANGSPVAHNIGSLLDSRRGRIRFFIGTPEGGVNDAGTETDNFRFSAGNGLFPHRGLPAGQSRPNSGRITSEPIANVTGPAFDDFYPRGVILKGLDFNRYPNGIAEVVVSVIRPKY